MLVDALPEGAPGNEPATVASVKRRWTVSQAVVPDSKLRSDSQLLRLHSSYSQQS